MPGTTLKFDSPILVQTVAAQATYTIDKLAEKGSCRRTPTQAAANSMDPHPARFVR